MAGFDYGRMQGTASRLLNRFGAKDGDGAPALKLIRTWCCDQAPPLGIQAMANKRSQTATNTHGVH